MTFRLIVLGCGSAIPAEKANPASYLLNIHEKLYLIDCGEGTQLRLKSCGIRFQKISRIFISHLHGDHFFGLIGLLSTMHLLGRMTKLDVYAPEGIQEIIDVQHKYSGGRFSFPLHYHVLTKEKSEEIIDEKDLTVTSFPLKHKIPCFGFVFRERQTDLNIKTEAIRRYNIPVTAIKDIKRGGDLHTVGGEIIPNNQLTHSSNENRSFAYCSDTSYDESILPHIRSCNLVFHEATFAEDLIQRAEETSHSTARQSAQIAIKANAGKLLIGHLSSRYRKNTEKVLKEARDIFPQTLLAEEGMAYDVEFLITLFISLPFVS